MCECGGGRGDEDGTGAKRRHAHPHDHRDRAQPVCSYRGECQRGRGGQAAVEAANRTACGLGAQEIEWSGTGSNRDLPLFRGLSRFPTMIS
jgi:hypothetical protein